ncbi:MAG: lysozyme [Ignavibacteriota bacterium]
MPQTPTTPNLAVPQSVIDHLKLREGWRPDVYLDSLKKPTAGMGHLLVGKEITTYHVGSKVPLSILDAWAQADSLKAYTAALSQAAELHISSKDFIKILTSVNFQLGTGWRNTFPTTWGLMKQGKWTEAAAAVKKSKWFTQTPVRVADFQTAMVALATPPSMTGMTQHPAA